MDQPADGSTTRFQIAKLNDDQQLVFGFANVSVSRGSDGSEFFDLQKDAIPGDELERAAYRFVLESREGGEMHEGETIGQLVESFVFTPDKLKALIANPITKEADPTLLAAMSAAIPPRWWVGFKLEPAAYQAVKSGKYRMFSIAGEADRQEV